MVIIAFLSVVTIYRLFVQSANAWLGTDGPDHVTHFEQRFTRIQDVLPSAGIVGYVTEISPQQVMADGNAQAEYYLTQYALSPLIIDNDPRHAFVIDNFHASLIPDLRTYGRFVVVKDAGTGIVLLKNRDAQE